GRQPGAPRASWDGPVAPFSGRGGVTGTDTLGGLFDGAAWLANQPRPAGRGVGIVTNVGGPAILCADACEAQGLQVPLLAAETQARLREFLPAEASIVNPVDMIAAATAEQFNQAIGAVAADPGIHAVVAIFIPPLVTRPEDVASALVTAAADLPGTKPLLSVFMGSRGVPGELRTASVQIPSYAFPEAAAIALAHAARYAEWRARPLVEPPALEGLRPDEAAAIVARSPGRGGGGLERDEVAALLGCYGLPLVEQRTAPTPAEAGAAAEALGGAVALKALVPGLVHKTEAGAVRLHLDGADSVRAAAADMSGRLAADGHTPTGFLVQRMAASGVEMLVCIVHDAQFGPVVACGAGGTLLGLPQDLAGGPSP